MANFVQLYKSTDLNAPVLTGQVGALITVLNKCLVDGYTTASVTSLTESGTNYTAVLAVANTTLVVGNYITFAGASPAGANIAMKINTVTDSTHVICTGPGSLGAITGTITYQKSPLGWAKPFSAGTNAQTYRSPDTGGNRFYLQVIDNGATAGGAKEAQAYGAEVMSGDQVVTSGQFPTVAQAASGVCWRKSATADATARAWTLIGDDRTFYFIPTTGDAFGNNPFGFGHFISFKPGDGFNTFVAGAVAFNTTTGVSGLAYNINPAQPLSAVGMWVPRLYSQTGGSVACEMTGMPTSVTTSQIIGASAWVTYPNPSDNGLYCTQLLLLDSPASLRGRMPGYYGPWHTTPLNNYDVVTGVTGLSGVTLTALQTSAAATSFGQVLVDTFGPWS